jgi:Na+/H+ antiporter NhaC
MRAAEAAARSTRRSPQEGAGIAPVDEGEPLQAAGAADTRPPGPVINLVLPVAATVLMMPVGLLITGDGDWRAGSGVTAVLWAVSAGVLVAMVLYRLQGRFRMTEMVEHVLEGFSELVGLAAILALALAIGDICNALGTGPWVAETASAWIGPVTLAPLIFLTGCLISFSTGSSWGTFAILMPIAIPMATVIGLPLSLATAAVMGGGIFGDHCSPISDTTVISSLSAGCDHIEHVATQLPYALSAGGAATVLYLIAGWLLA